MFSQRAPDTHAGESKSASISQQSFDSESATKKNSKFKLSTILGTRLKWNGSWLWEIGASLISIICLALLRSGPKFRRVWTIHRTEEERLVSWSLRSWEGWSTGPFPAWGRMSRAKTSCNSGCWMLSWMWRLCREKAKRRDCKATRNTNQSFCSRRCSDIPQIRVHFPSWAITGTQPRCKEIDERDAQRSCTHQRADGCQWRRPRKI